MTRFYLIVFKLEILFNLEFLILTNNLDNFYYNFYYSGIRI